MLQAFSSDSSDFMSVAQYAGLPALPRHLCRVLPIDHTCHTAAVHHGSVPIGFLDLRQFVARNGRIMKIDVTLFLRNVRIVAGTESFQKIALPKLRQTTDGRLQKVSSG